MIMDVKIMKLLVLVVLTMLAMSPICGTVSKDC